MAVSRDDILDALWNKHELLYDFLQELNERLDPDDRPDHEGVILNAELEIQRTEAVYDLIDNNKPIPFPSDEQVKALARATGALQQVVGKNAAINKMITAATALIKTWPVSRGG